MSTATRNRRYYASHREQILANKKRQCNERKAAEVARLKQEIKEAVTK